MIGIMNRVLAFARSAVVRVLRDPAAAGVNRAWRAAGSMSASSRRPETASLLKFPWPFIAAIAATIPIEARGQVPNLLNYQGRVLVSGAAFSGTGVFKFALVSGDGTQTYWRNSADNNGDGQPDLGVSLAVAGGLFSLFLGDTNLVGMAELPVSVFTNGAVHLRIWFNDGAHGFQQLVPDQPVGAAGYAMMTANIADGSITATKLAPNAATVITSTLSARVDGLTTQVAALANQLSSVSNQVSGSIMSGLTAVSTDPQDASLEGVGFQFFTAIAAPGWVTSTGRGGAIGSDGAGGRLDGAGVIGLGWQSGRGH